MDDEVLAYLAETLWLIDNSLKRDKDEGDNATVRNGMVFNGSD